MTLRRSGHGRLELPALTALIGKDLEMASFEDVASEYDAARPSYPAGVYDALEPLQSLVVLDVGAGTGIAARQLDERGASVIALDPGREVLRRAVVRSPTLPAVVADGGILPVRTGGVDLICVAQAWHWLDETTRGFEAHRVLRDGGRWAGWWSHARADEEDWFDAYWSVIEHRCTGTHRAQRDIDWGATIASPGRFEVSGRSRTGSRTRSATATSSRCPLTLAPSWSTSCVRSPSGASRTD